MFESIYVLSYKELKVVRDYLDKNLKKRFIREQKLLVEYLIIFILKRDRSLRLYVNYRKLNNITFKKRNLSLNISKPQDQLDKIKNFKKLDLKLVYNLIRIKEGKVRKPSFK